MNETTYELRELKSSDMFVMFSILNKIGFKEFKDALTRENIENVVKSFVSQKVEEGGANDNEEVATYVGFSIVTKILEIVVRNLPSCEQDVYKLLSNLSGMTMKKISDLPMVTFTQMIVDVIKKDEFKDFFKVVSGLFK